MYWCRFRIIGSRVDQRRAVPSGGGELRGSAGGARDAEWISAVDQSGSVSAQDGVHNAIDSSGGGRSPQWTRNNPKAGIRNGQGFVVTGLEADGTATIQDGAGQTSTINLSGNQYIDYAWVSTTYSSQGKTAERVLALLGETTNREAFYVAISRAKRAVTLYTTSQADLVRLAQVSRAKENVSDYVPLTQQVMTYGQHEQRDERKPEPIPSFDPRAVGERIGNRVAEQLRAATGRDLRQHAAGAAPRRPRPDLGRGFGDVAAALEPELGILGRAIAAYRQRRDLLRCAGDLAGAVAAVNCGLEQLERATQDRVGLAAAVDRVAEAVGRTVGREQIEVDAPEPKAGELRGSSIWRFGRNTQPGCRQRVWSCGWRSVRCRMGARLRR
jgi:hypothetical protein